MSGTVWMFRVLVRRHSRLSVFTCWCSSHQSDRQRVENSTHRQLGLCIRDAAIGRYYITSLEYDTMSPPCLTSPISRLGRRVSWDCAALANYWTRVLLVDVIVIQLFKKFSRLPCNRNFQAGRTRTIVVAATIVLLKWNARLYMEVHSRTTV